MFEDCMSHNLLLGSGCNQESSVVEPVSSPCPLRVHSGNAKSQLHQKTLKKVLSKNRSFRKCNKLYFRVPFPVTLISEVKHSDKLHYINLSSASGDVLVISSNNYKLVSQAKYGILQSMRIMKNHLPAVKTPAQMVKEGGW